MHYMMSIVFEKIKSLAIQCGFDLRTFVRAIDKYQIYEI